MSAYPFLEVYGDGVRLRLHIQPGARETELAGVYGDRLKVRVKDPPVDGKANAELIKFFSQSLKIAGGRVAITSGDKGRSKTLQLSQLSVEQVVTWLDHLL